MRFGRYSSDLSREAQLTVMSKPMAIFYEHPEWFKPLFKKLEERGIPHEHVLAHQHHYEPDHRDIPYSLVVNRVSPSSYLRGHTSAIFYALQYLQHLDTLGIPTVNGYKAHLMEVSKARQLGLLKRLGIPHPRSLVVNAASQIPAAAAELEFPIIIKPNIGGSGAGMQRFDSMDDVRAAVTDGLLDDVFILDSTAIVQEFHPAVDDTITRVEALDGNILYAINIHNDPSLGFNLCPLSLEQRREAAQIEQGEACSTQSRSVEQANPPEDVLEATLAIFHAAQIDIGGLEYLVSQRDGLIYFYDINAVSNFVANAPEIVGFDPFDNFADYLQARYKAIVGEAVAVGGED
jgi:glutathione synthase/RimK-type ligase-like ATP-grasp enzyme